MEESLIQLFEQVGPFAIWLSLISNILISILGLLPSVFITAANVLFFGYMNGLLISILGEALGSIISFILYRKWLNKWKNKKRLQHPQLKQLEKTEGMNAFWLILCFRLLPFIPSGGVTLGSALSKVSLRTFTIASTLGKIPSLIIEASALYGLMFFETKWKIIISILLIVILFWKTKKKTECS
ncbi:TVP38/TMEM64 family protein [Ureibacillus chungkukjangi]|uniref:TVP38/TMEM64 family membrane protein n=1 Tax=Ureibacillus chungkukjangi TaxID=1202712 RepID=A0A318TA73_9BACL|nr:VTT domain-containing protein [Ureibacillus chungkukjangi]PYF01861.1 putative membrane protein YdjX (TVP38/TMEM64 family) [Ureibacillus chungkukjangi]